MKIGLGSVGMRNKVTRSARMRERCRLIHTEVHEASVAFKHVSTPLAAALMQTVEGCTPVVIWHYSLRVALEECLPSSIVRKSRFEFRGFRTLNFWQNKTKWRHKFCIVEILGQCHVASVELQSKYSRKYDEVAFTFRPCGFPSFNLWLRYNTRFPEGDDETAGKHLYSCQIYMSRDS